MKEMQQWTTVIKPTGKLWSIDFVELWAYRDLYSLFVKRDIITQYKQTILGPIWFFVQPLLTTIMYMVVFGGIAGISTDGLPQALFYLSGILCWQYFADCLNSTSSTFITYQNIFGKVYFPRLIVPLATVTSNLVRLGIQTTLLILVYCYFLLFTEFPLSANWALLLFPILVFLLAGLALGFGMIISSLTTKYRDLTILFTFIVQLWMYATPIIYPLSVITNPDLRLAMSLNPVTGIVETFRYSVLGVGEFSWGLLGYSAAFMAVLLVAGMVVFNKVQRSFMDTV
ncbi:MAG: ABC transporter permease [Rikenellaceae bacterium]